MNAYITPILKCCRSPPLHLPLVRPLPPSCWGAHAWRSELHEGLHAPHGWMCDLQTGFIRNLFSLHHILGHISLAQISLAFICVIFMERQRGCQQACDVCAKVWRLRRRAEPLMLKETKVDGGQRSLQVTSSSLHLHCDENNHLVGLNSRLAH